ncbi:WRKY transcription factor 54 WRKY DNA-binding protein [Vigna angularis]|uniref:WRKY transcription factor 54 WRKY DNA-binding protein n=1 Tax=Phaseolus angularis TaxID=3914 RepID=A0A8T0K611_PHAAN|nr:WRKY transcription factor 54 WRKY DNA-binding protein [Vigna angularis]
MEDLVKGHEAATELRLLLQNPFGTEPSLSSHHLIAKVLRSFTQALTIINSSPLAPASADGLAHRNLLFSGENGPSVPRSGNCPTSGDCRFYCSVTSTRTLLRLLIRIITERFDELGCVRIKSLLTWTELSYTTDDNHAWRKYGQKKILNSEFPRCTHRYDKGCKATKQVQRDEQYPQMYQTTYIGSHTCNAISEIVTNSTDSSNWESYLLNSDHDSVHEPLIAHQP